MVYLLLVNNRRNPKMSGNRRTTGNLVVVIEVAFGCGELICQSMSEGR